MDGQLDVFKKLISLHKRNNFSFALIVGNLFASPSESNAAQEDDLTALLSGSISIPFTTYFSTGTHPLPSRIIERLRSREGQVCENLYYLGNRTVLKTSGGINIVALGGLHNLSLTAGYSKEQYEPFFTASGAQSLQNVKSTDILLTSIWPSSIRNGSKVVIPQVTTEPLSSDEVSELCLKLQPRYHLSASLSFFYEREPFLSPLAEETGLPRQVTRFISLASIGNARKEKSLYAFSIDSEIDLSAIVPQGTTSCPFSASVRKRVAAAVNKPYSRFSQPDYRPPKRSRRAPPGPEECFFCLANPNIVTHLIASIGDDSYLTAARGPLPSATTYTLLKGCCHMLIIPLPHCPRLSDIAEPAVRSSTLAEMNRYRQALQVMVDGQSDGQLGAVTWEVNRKQGVHAHWQFLPVSNDLIRRSLVEAAFKVEAENEKYPPFENVDGEFARTNERDTFQLWIWGRFSPASNAAGDNDRPSNNKARNEEGDEQFIERLLLLPLPEHSRFDLQFGRRVMAKLLELEGRMNWKDCLQSESEESDDVEAFKENFRQYDFSLEDKETA